jgi:hypothetical protein
MAVTRCSAFWTYAAEIAALASPLVVHPAQAIAV